ncbi:hypothetical protein KO504_04010 [Winogradskyella psychrotolerans]|uniref:Lipoprotein n=1 Tax=Winogradskyella damuponensis TaxID=943939 RepID=A0ABP8CZ74_9FLAO|nr:hypothetical protein [Winogradskyella psychrotolerans]MBU2920494.1 hypothetical protein [Winogradskyella psychrotolerans]
MKKIAFVIFFCFLLIGCSKLLGEEVARLEINKTSNTELYPKEAALSLSKGEKISFWTDTDVVYEDDVALIYTVEIWKDSVNIGGLKLDALKTNPTVMELRKTIGNKTSWSFSGKMKHITIKETGNYTFKAILNSSDNPSLKINKAELVLKK